MVIEFDITNAMIRNDYFYSNNFGRSAMLVGEIGDWLVDRDHDGEIFLTQNEYGDMESIHIQFEEEELAMLFKLTWM